MTVVCFYLSSTVKVACASQRGMASFLHTEAAVQKDIFESVLSYMLV